MSDSDISKILSGSPYNQSVPPERLSERSFHSARIISLPDRIRESHEDKISGKVLRHDKDNNLVVIKTPKGEVTLKTEKDFPVQDDDMVEIKLTKLPFDQTAYIRAQNNKTQISPPSSYIPIDQIVTSGDLQNAITQIKGQSTIEIIPLSPLQIKNIKPIPHPIISNVILPSFEVQNISFLSDILLNKNTIDFSEILSNSPINILDQSLQLVSSFYTEPLHNVSFSMQALPFKSTIVKLMKINQDHLLLFQPDSSSNSLPSQFFKEGFLNEITPSRHNENTTFNTNFVAIPTHAKAGDLEMILIGHTSEMEFPVLERINTDHNDRIIFALKGKIDHAIENSVFIITPTLGIAATNNTLPISSAFLQSPFLTPPQIWDSLDELFQTLKTHAPIQAQAMSLLIPNSASPMKAAHGALFFIAALRSGDLQNWMGEKAIDTIRRAGKFDSLQKFLKEATDISSINDTPSEWKSTALPYVHDQHIYRIHIHSRKEYPPQDQEEKKGGTTRFIIDLSLSKIGKVQLDGLFQGNEQQNIGRLDLIVRTQQSFSKASQFEMRELYSNALRETNFTGELTFQNDPNQWVNISPQHTLERFSEKI